MLPIYGFNVASTTMYVATSTMLLSSLYLIRALYRSSITKNRWIHIAVIASFLIQLLTIYYEPIALIFGCTPLTIEIWGLIALLTMMPIAMCIMAKIMVVKP